MNLRPLLAAATAALCLGTAERAAASNVYYYDPDFGHPYGQQTDNGGTPYVFPAWACGRRYFSPSSYQWIGEDGNEISSGEFTSDIHVWLTPRPGCMTRDEDRVVGDHEWHETFRIESKDGDTVYSPPLGRHYMIIHSSFGGYWINDNGGWPACDCTLPLGFAALAKSFAPWTRVAEGFGRVASLPPSAGVMMADRTRQALQDLQSRLASALAARRQMPLSTLEGTVRALEDRSSSSLANAARLGEQCRRNAAAAATDAAYRSCNEAAGAVRMARAALAVVADELHR